MPAIPSNISIKIFILIIYNNPTIKSSLTFLRKTPWARAKVESLYLYARRRKIVKGKQPPAEDKESEGDEESDEVEKLIKETES